VLKKRLFFWKRTKSRLEDLPAEQLRHIIVSLTTSQQQWIRHKADSNPRTCSG
jgi:hypothetical protein